MSKTVVSMLSSKSLIVSGLTFRSLINFEFTFVYGVRRASLVAQMVKNPPAMRETWVRSMGWEDALEKEMATHFNILAWRIPLDRETWQATVHEVTNSQTRLSD